MGNCVVKEAIRADLEEDEIGMYGMRAASRAVRAEGGNGSVRVPITDAGTSTHAGYNMAVSTLGLGNRRALDKDKRKGKDAYIERIRKNKEMLGTIEEEEIGEMIREELLFVFLSTVVHQAEKRERQIRDASKIPGMEPKAAVTNTGHR